VVEEKHNYFQTEIDCHYYLTPPH